MNWTKSADQIIKSGSDVPWYDRPIRPEKRISKLEHELNINCNPCSDDRCLKCNPDLPQRRVEYNPVKDTYNVRTIVGDYVTSSDIIARVFDQQMLYIQEAKMKASPFSTERVTRV